MKSFHSPEGFKAGVTIILLALMALIFSYWWTTRGINKFEFQLDNKVLFSATYSNKYKLYNNGNHYFLERKWNHLDSCIVMDFSATTSPENFIASSSNLYIPKTNNLPSFQTTERINNINFLVNTYNGFVKRYFGYINGFIVEIDSYSCGDQTVAQSILNSIKTTEI